MRFRYHDKSKFHLSKGKLILEKPNTCNARDCVDVSVHDCFFNYAWTGSLCLGSPTTFSNSFFRNIFGLAFLLPLLMRSRFAILRTKQIGLHALRGVINMAAMLMFFTALAISPIAKVTALGFTAPIFMAILAVLVLGERFRIYRWSAIFLGFVGMLIILRPGLVAIDTGALLVIGSAALWAVAMIIIKIQSRTESSLTIVAYMGIFLGVFSIGPAVWVWQPFGLQTLGFMVLIGLFGSIAQMAISESLKETDSTALCLSTF